MINTVTDIQWLSFIGEIGRTYGYDGYHELSIEYALWAY